MGTLCVIDRSARSFEGEQLLMLKDIAALVEAELQAGLAHETIALFASRTGEDERAEATDPRTRTWAHDFMLEFLDSELAYSQRCAEPLSIALLDIDHFRAVNQSHGRSVGDQVLEAFAQRVQSAARPQDALGRLNDDRFLLLMSGTALGDAARMSETIRAHLATAPFVGDVRLSTSIGVVSASEDATTSGLLAAAERALANAKRNGRNQVQVDASD